MKRENEEAIVRSINRKLGTRMTIDDIRMMPVDEFREMTSSAP